MTHTTLTVDGMTCDACKTAVREALELPGVREVGISLDTGIVDVAHTDGVTVEALVSAIEETGYEVREAHSG
ncbi:MAG: heavy-metal-associated domain-containing protein [Solirubrobacteraceae bacterium]